MATKKSKKSFVYNFKFEFMAKEHLSGDDRNRIEGVLVELIQKNEHLLGENVLSLSYGTDSGQEVRGGTWKRMIRNKAMNDALRAEQEMADHQEWLSQNHFEKSLPKEAEKYAKDSASYVTPDGEMFVEGTLEELISRIPKILQTDELLFSFNEDLGIKFIEVADSSGDLYVRMGQIEIGPSA
jgi:hypothetical protein